MPVTNEGERRSIDQPDLTTAHRGHDLSWSTGSVQRIIYHYDTDHRKAFMHPVRSATGATLTAFEPADHPWHRGVWFAWKYLNGVNFWEETADAIEDGRTVFTGLEEVRCGVGRTRVVTHYDYQTPSGAVLLQERRTVEVAAQAPQMIAVDWDLSFTAREQDVCLDRTVITPETWWGGYAGFSFRSTEAWQDVRGLDSEGRRNQEINYQRARWVQLTGVGEDGRRAGVALFDHPQNPRYPSYWYYSDPTGRLGFAYINPALLLHEAYHLSSGAPLRLRYRLLVLDWELTAGALDEQHRKYGASVPADE